MMRGATSPQEVQVSVMSAGMLVNRLSGPRHSHLGLMTASFAGRWGGFNASPLAPQKWR